MSKKGAGKLETRLLEKNLDALFAKLLGNPDKPRKEVSVLALLAFIESVNKTVAGANLKMRDFYDPKDITVLPSFRQFMGYYESIVEWDKGEGVPVTVDLLKAQFAYNYVFGKIFDNPNPDARAIEDEFGIDVDPEKSIQAAMSEASNAAELDYRHQAYENIIRTEFIKTDAILLRTEDLLDQVDPEDNSKTALSELRAAISVRIDAIYRR